MFQISMFMRVILTLDLVAVVSMAEGLAEGYVKIGKSATASARESEIAIGGRLSGRVEGRRRAGELVSRNDDILKDLNHV